jgi:hypothetical protein
MIAIHQSQFLPWLPFFYKMFQSDVFVILDDVQFQKNGVQNRNMIATAQGAAWVTIPVLRNLGTAINEVGIADLQALKKIARTIELNYRRSPFFDEVFTPLSFVLRRDSLTLHELNMELLRVVLDLMKQSPSLIMASTLGTSSRKDDLVLEIIKKTGEKRYLSGRGALEYMDMNKFRDSGVEVAVCNFNYEPYLQPWVSTNGFIPNLSVIDLLFNNLDHAVEYIMSNGSLGPAECIVSKGAAHVCDH